MSNMKNVNKYTIFCEMSIEEEITVFAKTEDEALQKAREEFDEWECRTQGGSEDGVEYKVWSVLTPEEMELDAEVSKLEAVK